MIDVCKSDCYIVTNRSPIVLSNSVVQSESIKQAIVNTNITIRKIVTSTRSLDLELFDAVDFRNLSGVIGELFATELADLCPNLTRNPHFHGYPDIIQIATREMEEYVERSDLRGFVHYPYGGIEVKNTFGTKKQKAALSKGDTRILQINKKLDWKAHHRETNYLLGIVSDYLEGIPTITAACFSSELTVEDWNEKQEPGEESAMTSFTAISNSGFRKMKAGLRVCLDSEPYRRFFMEE